MINKEILKNIAERMMAPGKGILAIDESFPTIKKRFEAVGVVDSEENRRAYRELLITTPELEKYISGIILFDETLRQSSSDGKPFPEVLKSKGIITGIKVDKGAKDSTLYPGEKVTEGLDGLQDRLAEYLNFDVEFAKWRAILNIGENMPSPAVIKANAHALALYAVLCQEVDIVPMVEPEILIDGDHSIEECYIATAATLKALFIELKEQGIYLEGIILKVSMVLTGKDNPNQASVEEVAKETVRCLKENVPSEVAGIVFLSGGQSDERATAHLDAISKLSNGLPWPLSFSYGRGIQNPALKIWAENKDNVVEAQEAVLSRSKANALASEGKYN